jgi:hypothetical protein
MHKKIEAELVSIAHGILQMKNKADVVALQQRAKDAYEKLSVLAFVDRYLQTTPNVTETKEELLEKITQQEEPKSQGSPKEEIATAAVPPKEKDKKAASKSKPEKQSPPPPVEEDLFSLETKTSKPEQTQIGNNTLEEELKDTIPVDVATEMFEKAIRVEEPQRKSLNDKLVHSNLQIGLNDRIAFVKHLFEGSQEDFNRVVSQLNSFKTEKDANKFLNKTVKPDYDWIGKEAYEERFVTLITRKFA